MVVENSVENIEEVIEDIETISEEQNTYENFDIKSEIQRDTVRSVVVRQIDQIEYPMVCINCAKHKRINKFALDGLRCLLESCQIDDINDEVPVYINTESCVLEVGRASYNKLYRYLDNFVKTCISPEIKVYRFTSQSEKERIDKSDPTKVILNL